MMSAALPAATPGMVAVPLAASPTAAPAEPGGESPPNGFARALDAAEAGLRNRAARTAESPADTGARPSGREAADGSARRGEPDAAPPGARPTTAAKALSGKPAAAGPVGRGSMPVASDGDTATAEGRTAETAEGAVEPTRAGAEAPAPDGDATTLLAELRAHGASAGVARADTGTRAGAEALAPADTPRSDGQTPATEGRPPRATAAVGGTGPADPARAAAEAEPAKLLQPSNEVQPGPAGEAPAARTEAPGTLLAPPLASLPPAAASGPGNATSAAEARLTAAPGSTDFASQLGAQLSTFVREGVQQARLHLHPAELGPVTVRIQVEGQAAQVHLAAEHALTRQALEQSMPLLAGSLREAGLTLSGGGVFEQPRQRDGGSTPGRSGAGHGSAAVGEHGAAAPLHITTGVPARRGVVDLVA